MLSLTNALYHVVCQLEAFLTSAQIGSWYIVTDLLTECVVCTLIDICERKLAMPTIQLVNTLPLNTYTTNKNHIPRKRNYKLS